ncbi:uncharacterized protein EHS24_009009 [Apiotrichum porosum]|uniref:SWIM-type domain-containing protein n=1 Tax=Apiotrichum porosum TaxID=105984 RepID=A0A427XND9_9TREE|nr:uncharacterized protein EHS24_009009 [Apiotrichum porosum]RSH80431.1 hypothetical protein EHS24_009009 [Apiotrichum porosum]
MGHKKECFPDGTPLDTRPPRVKRKKPTADGPASDELVTPGDTKDLNNNQASTSKKPKPIVDKDAPKRSARFRKKAPISINERMERVMAQRMFMVDRIDASIGDERMEIFKVAGSTGNVYTITLGSTIMSCDCPDALKGNCPCKHLIFIFLKVLKVPRSSHIWYQKALLPDEVAMALSAKDTASASASNEARKAYLRAAGAVVTDDDDAGPSEAAPQPSNDDGKRLSALGDDCPVCFEEMTAEENDRGQLVFDMTAQGCGKPLHTQCFNMWSSAARKKGGPITCVWCRAAWETPAATKGDPNGQITTSSKGYVLGMSGVRDISSYYQGPLLGRGRNPEADGRYDSD